MALQKVQLTNNNQSWNEKRRYKVNDVVSYSGNTYQNITGKNSIPTNLEDWIVFGSAGVSVTGTERQVIGFDEDGNELAVTIGWKQLSDLPTPPSFSNGVYVGTAFQPDGSALFAFIELAITSPDSIAKPNAIPIYQAGTIGTGGGTLPVQDPVEDLDAVNKRWFIDNLNLGATFSQRFFKNSFTSSTGFTFTSLTPTYVDGKMRLTGGVGNFNQYFTIDGLKNTDENIELELIFKATTVNTGSFGLAIGKKSINSWYDASVVCSLSPVQASAYLWDPTNTTQLGSKVLNSINSGDILKLKYTQVANVITCSFYNITQNTKGQFSITGNLKAVKNIKIPNSSDIRIYNLGGTMDIISIKVTSLSNASPNILCIGDSKTVGYSAGGNELRWASNINSLGTVIVNAGDGDRTVEVTQTINYTKLLNAKHAILCIGRNDLGSSVSTGTWQLNYQNIVSELQNQGTKVIHLLPIPETVLADQSILKNWIISTYGVENTIDPSTGWNSSTMLSSDNVHPNEVGHAHISNIVINSGLIEPQIINRFAKINELDSVASDLTVNTSNYIPYANSTAFSDSDLYRISSGRYVQGSTTGYNFGTGFQTYEITGLNYGLLAVSKIGSTIRWYFSGDNVNGFIGLNNNGTNQNFLTLFPDGRLLAPTLTNALIDSGGNKSVISKEYLDNRFATTIVQTRSSNASADLLASSPLGNYYEFEGSIGTWALPTPTGNATKKISVINTGTGNLTIATHDTSSLIYNGGLPLVNTYSLIIGSTVDFYCDGDKWIKM